MKSGIFKYQIGLSVIGTFTVVLLIIVLLQAGGTKQDATTAKAANNIATNLNNYVASRQTVPASISSVGVTKVPSTITYQKLSDTSYKFCVTYKTASSGFDASSTFTDVVARGVTGTTPSTDSYDYASNGYLYLPPNHKKGQDCQTVNIDSYYGGGYESTYDSSGGGPEDTERVTDLRSLQGQLEAYYAENGRYPSTTDLGSSSADNVKFITANMKGLDKEALRDPAAQDGDYALADTETTNEYSYQPANDSGTACDDSGTNDCTSYILSATLDDGLASTLYSLN